MDCRYLSKHWLLYHLVKVYSAGLKQQALWGSECGVTKGALRIAIESAARWTDWSSHHAEQVRFGIDWSRSRGGKGRSRGARPGHASTSKARAFLPGRGGGSSGNSGRISAPRQPSSEGGEAASGGLVSLSFCLSPLKSEAVAVVEWEPGGGRRRGSRGLGCCLLLAALASLAARHQGREGRLLGPRYRTLSALLLFLLIVFLRP
jgi:hypothetical protein